MANIFENCSYHSPYEPYYLNCTNTTNQCTLVQDVETIESIIFWIDFLIPCTLFVVACFLNAYYLSILVPEFTEMNDITKKQYIFMVSRAISALTACVIMLALRILQLITSSFTIYFLFFLIDDLSFYSLLGSYVGSAILLYLATIRPILYSNRISVRTVYKFAIANLITSVVLAIGDFTTDNSVSKSARTRLAWTLFTFTLITLTEAIPSFYLVGTSIDSSMIICSNFYKADHLIVPFTMNSLKTLAWAIALNVDPLCSLLFDPRIRKVWVQHTEKLKLVIQNTICGFSSTKSSKV
ncbi:G_PROTEIN_RECEP_F1_2 domain-containing protein [Caenorhabditis elegans]|uniref:G_PROTEIN_RECEP_F1_2 domain-containing protein n=1 Tax=Caenorhabditis elegans TaxID=6239 RepID=G8JXY4_CAEEL|nr:G_PROTEIN_RECEP_F1_2 domain-containing protein [Caenorhabditis elegans]CCD61510.1 G_PROTEIN_RECEP_F1_2 domain-containing protein [Caenorhabditis elegans]|eukprot:NP_001254930.1 Putative G-protein coupled receptor B0244.4 [Caenorhabditis elegans]